MTTEVTLTEGALKIWWIPQIPMKSFEFLVKDLAEGKKFLEVLADYDAFQYENNIKPDYSNMGGLVRLEPDNDLPIHGRVEKYPAPTGLGWFDIDGSELWEEWEALNNES